MKKSFVTIAILVSGILAGSIFGVSCNSKKSEQSHEETEGHKMDSTAMTYACPMHSEVTGKEGDTCSKCGMKLEAVKGSDSTKNHKH